MAIWVEEKNVYKNDFSKIIIQQIYIN